MDVRGGCFNCGKVEYCHLPYRALIEELDRENYKDSISTYTVDGDGKSRQWICSNCGWAKMIVLYHDNLKSPEPLKAAEVDFARGD